MNKRYYVFIIAVFLCLISCKKEVEELPVSPGTPTTPVIPDESDTVSVYVDLNAVPYQSLSTYRFFVGDLKDMAPNVNVLPFEPISSLFTDYASKKRFVWMPEDVSASYVTDDDILNFPVGAVLIKHFYYEQSLPLNNQRIIETRLMIKKSTGWLFATYVWNEQQTEATLSTTGSNVPVSFRNNGETLSTTYRIPSNTECMICHKLVDDPIPIGVKPQHLNKDYAFADGAMNQLDKWIVQGYLSSRPTQQLTLVDYRDESKSLNERVRSYLDINCAHCHSAGKHCDYRPLKLAYSETQQMINLGLCVTPDELLDPSIQNIITPLDPLGSMMHFRMSTNEESQRMPLLGRSMVHREALTLLEQYINTIQSCE